MNFFFKIKIMKKTVFLVFCLVCALVTYGQQQKVHTLPEAVITPPELVKMNGQSSYLNDYLKDNINVQNNVFLWNEEGVEVVQFVVTPVGEIADIKVVNSISPGIDIEVTRVLNSTSGYWKPMMEDGKAVSFKKEVSIAFTSGENGTDHTAKFLKTATKEFTAGNKMFLEKNKGKKALYFYDRAICYLPYDKSLLLTRGLCKYQLGDKEGARKDWSRIRELGGFEGDSYLDGFARVEGYNEMVAMVVVK